MWHATYLDVYVLVCIYSSEVLWTGSVSVCCIIEKSTMVMNIKALLWGGIRCMKLGLGSIGIIKGALLTG